MLNDGIKFHEGSNSAVDLQLNQNKITNSDQITMLAGLSAKIISGKATEAEYMNAVRTAVVPIVVSLQTAINRALLLETEKDDMYFVVDYAELMKGDIRSRYEAYRIGLEANFLQPDEVRYMEDLKPLGLEFIKLGLNDVLYDTKTKEFYTPNTNQHAKMGESPLPNAEKGDIIQNREYIQDPETGLMMGSTPEGGGESKSGNDGDSGENSKNKPRKIGTVNFKDKDAVTSVIRDFEGRYAQADIEHCIVVTTQGEVYEIDGKQWAVDTTVLGDKMKGSINSHNHVTGESSYSFSKEDLESSIQDGSYRVEGFDEKYRYSMVIERELSLRTLYNAYAESELEVKEVMLSDYFVGTESIVDEDIQHEVIKRTCEKVGIKYEREKKE